MTAAMTVGSMFTSCGVYTSAEFLLVGTGMPFIDFGPQLLVF